MTNSKSAGKEELVGRTDLLALTPAQVATLFPFHLLFDSSLTLLQSGASIRKICPDLETGTDLGTLFELERPQAAFNFDFIAANPQMLYLLRRPRSPLRLRGQMVRLSDHEIAYLCSPWSPEPGFLRTLGLQVDDFPLHDAMPELVNVVRSQRLALDDLRELTGKLRQQRQELRDANEQLRVREAEYRRLALIAARTENCVIITGRDSRIEWVNPSFETLTGYTLDEAKGQTPGSLLQGPATDPVTIEYMREKIKVGENLQCEIINYSKTGRKYWVSIEVQPLCDDSGQVTNFMAIETDITARKESELLGGLAYSVTRILAETTDFKLALHEILKTICDRLGYVFGACWRVDDAANRLYCQSYWAVPRLYDTHFELETRSRRFEPGQGLPGAVWQANVPRWVPDLASDVNFPRSKPAAEVGLRSGFAFPVRLSAEVRGVLEFFSDHADEPSPGLLATLTSLGSQLEQFLERCEAEQERSEVISLLDSTFESTAEGILVTDAKGRPIRVNGQWIDIWAIPAALRDSLDNAEILNWINNQLQNPETRIATRKWLAEHPTESRSDLVRLKDGRAFDVLSTPHTMDGKTVGRVWMYRDVTETYRSQGEREQLVATLNSTLEATTDGILVGGLDEHIITFNQRFLDLWRIPAGMNIRERRQEFRQILLSQLPDPEGFRKRIEWLCQNPEEQGFDVIHFLDGRVYERYSQPQRVENRIEGRVWSYRDVTERWRADQALRESEERFRLVMQSATDAIITVDVKGKIVFASESAGRVFDYNAKDLPGTAVWRLIPPELRAGKQMRQLVRTSRQKHWQSVEVTALRSDGTRLPVEISLHRSRVGGKKFLTGVLRDITQRKFGEFLQQKAIEDAESANRAKSDFLANISHEIRTPLNSIVGLTEMLRATRLDPDQSDMLTSVWSSSESLLHLINDLLDFSKIEAGQVDIESVEFDPAALGEQVIEIVRLRATRKGIALYFIVEPPAAPHLIGDANRIRQVLINLLVNASKFTERGSITLRLQWEAGDDSKIQVRFIVEDTGIGIPVDVQARIFQKFFRIDTPVGRRAGGAGLGLSISSLLCAAMGGKIELDSTVAQGSKFTFTLTLKAAAYQPSVVESPCRALLLASVRNIDLIKAALNSAKVSVDAYSDAMIATAPPLPGHLYDVLILDQEATIGSEQLRAIATSSTDPRNLRWIHLISPGKDKPAAIALPGRVEDLEFPLTPARVSRALAALTQEQRGLELVAPEQRVGLRGSATPSAVLLVEDNPDSQAYARRVLDRAGHNVAVASTGTEAVDIARNASFDVILMDVMLPDMTGFQATQAIRDNERTAGHSRTPIVALTAHALQEYRDQAFTSDMDDYVTKPVRPQTLLDAVARWGKTSVQLPTATPEYTSVQHSAAANRETSDQIRINEDVADLVPEYLANMKIEIDKISQLLKDGKFDLIARIGHNLKGTGATFGFEKVSELGAQIEEAGKTSDPLRIKTLATEAEIWLGQVRWVVDT